MNTLMSPIGWQNPLFSSNELRDDDDIWKMIVDEGRDGVSSVSFVSDK